MSPSGLLSDMRLVLRPSVALWTAGSARSYMHGLTGVIEEVDHCRLGAHLLSIKFNSNNFGKRPPFIGLVCESGATLLASEQALSPLVGCSVL